MLDVILSVIVPAYNAEKTLSYAIDSVLIQKIAGVEVIVVDDGSTDKSREVIRSYGGRIVGLHQANRGASSARNTGIKASRGRFIKFLDADDYLLPFSLESQIAHATGLPERAISYGRMLSWFDKTGIIKPHSRRDNEINNYENIDRLLIDTPVTASLIYPREIIEEVRGFDERVGLMDDFDLFARCIFAGCTVAALPEPIYVYRHHESDNRISRRSSREDYRSLIEMFERHKAALMSGLCAYDHRRVALGLSRLIWIKGRTAARLNYRDEAICLFEISRSINKKSIVGRPPYIAMTRLFNPLLAEAAFEHLKRFRNQCR